MLDNFHVHSCEEVSRKVAAVRGIIFWSLSPPLLFVRLGPKKRHSLFIGCWGDTYAKALRGMILNVWGHPWFDFVFNAYDPFEILFDVWYRLITGPLAVPDFSVPGCSISISWRFCVLLQRLCSGDLLATTKKTKAKDIYTY